MFSTSSAQSSPFSKAKHLVLIGGGHSHAIVLRQFGKNPLPGARITLISEGVDTPYSGMVPGLVAGLYERSACYIDLQSLTQFSGANLIVDRAIGLDLLHQQVLCANHPPIPFDVLSINTGSTPSVPPVPGAEESTHSIPVKPIGKFLECWNHVLAAVEQTPEHSLVIGVVGGGVGGVEVILAMQRRLMQLLASHPGVGERLGLHLFHRDRELLTQNPPWVRRRLTQLLSDRGIQIHLKEQVKDFVDRQVLCASGLTVSCDYLFWVTAAQAPDWPRQAGLKVDDHGFIQVQDTLQSVSHPFVFAVGDAATMVNHPRPKAGVFAVRQGKPLAENLRRVLQGQVPCPFYPQQRYLSLIGTSELQGGEENQAIASWGPFAGGPCRLLWDWKDRIDRQFMAQFQNYQGLPIITKADQ
ncbi:MAG: FAD-dependent oxidoreductase [Leptolyngbyaceae cyanobacterium bins.59]|nr:FAD-dependent oxidoreductase [Leptolyngbyaceae cyanobacterium bins.59]